MMLMRVVNFAWTVVIPSLGVGIGILLGVVAVIRMTIVVGWLARVVSMRMMP
jgi:hypothetical protein